MKSNKFLVVLVAIVCVPMTFSSCSMFNREKTPESTSKTKSISSYIELTNAVDELINSAGWNQQLFESILNSTQALHEYKKLTFDNAESVYRATFRGAGGFVRQRVDSTMKCSKYINLNKWKKIAADVDEKLSKTRESFPSLQQPDPDLETVNLMIEQYDMVLGLSKSNFGKRVERVEPYNISYQGVETRIKQNQYWKEYFCNNIEITNAISSFPQRLESSKSRYYKELREEIQKCALDDSVSLDFLKDVIKRYNKFDADNSEKVAISKFAREYNEPIAPVVEINNEFWK